MKKYSVLLLSLMAMISASSTLLAAQNHIYFPFVVNDSQTLTELVFTNPTGKDATIKLTAYQQDGTIASLAQGSLSVPANSQVVLGANDFGEFRGWVLADSGDVAGVTGNLRVGSPDRTSLDIAEPAQPATTIILPFMAQGAGAATEISLVNPNASSARIDVKLYDRESPDGKPVGSVFKVLPPYGMLSGTLNTLFTEVASFDKASHLVAKSTPLNIFSPIVNIIGFEIVRGFESISQKIFARTDAAALTATPLSNTGPTLEFPHVPTGMNWISLMGLVDLTGSAQSASISYLDDSGNLISAPKNPTNVSIPANGSVRLTSKELFGIPDDNLRSGSVRVSSDGNLAGFLGVGTMAGSSLGASPAQVTANTEFLLPAVDESGEAFTGIVLLNPGDAAASANLFLISSAGATLGRRSVTLQPQQRLVNRVKELFLEGLNQSDGYIYVASSAPLFAQGFLGVPDKTMSTLSPQVTLAGFVPPAQSIFVIRGKVTFATETATGIADAPVANITVALSKGANQLSTATTDAHGEFLFRNLTSGIYTVAPESTGKTFDPQSLTVTLATSSKSDADFSLLDLQVPVVTYVTPKETVARYEINSPGLTITVNGFGFRPGAQVLFDDKPELNGVAIHTTFVSSTELKADLPAQLLRFAGVYTVRVLNTPTEVSGEAVNFIVCNLVPEITYLDLPGLGPDNLPLPELTPIPIFGPGPGPVSIDIKINGKDFHPPGLKDPGTLVGIANTVPDIFPAVVPLIGSTPQCILVNSRSPFPLGVRVYDLAGNPAAGVSVTFTAPSVVTTAPTGSFPGGVSTVTVVTDADGFAFAPVFTANPFAGTYVVSAEATVGGFLLTTVFNLTNYNSGETCSSFGLAGQVEYVSSQQIIVHGVAIPNKGTYTVQVANVSPCGGYSNPRSFVITDAQPGTNPIIISLNPRGVDAGSPSFTLTVGGANFTSTSWINFGAVRLSTTFLDSNTLTATVPASLVASSGIVPVTVTKPGTSTDTGGTSRRVEFIVRNIPTVTFLSPSSIKAGSSDFTLTVSGANFQSNAFINFGTTALTTQYVDANTLKATVPASLVAFAGNVAVSVTNPGGLSDTGGTSPGVTFKINP